MMAEQISDDFDELWPELQVSNAKIRKRMNRPAKIAAMKVAESHFKGSRSQDEEFEGVGGGSMDGEHQRPELMLLERCVDSAETLDGQSLPE